MPRGLLHRAFVLFLLAAPAGGESPPADFASVSLALARALEAGYVTGKGFVKEREGERIIARGDLPADLAALLMTSPELSSPLWRRELGRPFESLTRSRTAGASAAAIGSEHGAWEKALLLHAATGDPFWRDVSRARAAPEPGTAQELLEGRWGLLDALDALRDPALIKALARSVESHLEPCDVFPGKDTADVVCPSAEPDPHGAAALALLASPDGQLRALGARQAQLLATEHRGEFVGYTKPGPADYPSRSSASPRSSWRAQALAIHAWLAAGRATDADALRRRLLAACWDSRQGGFLRLELDVGSGRTQPRPVRGVRLADQFWALLCFARHCFPYNSNAGGAR